MIHIDHNLKVWRKKQESIKKKRKKRRKITYKEIQDVKVLLPSLSRQHSNDPTHDTLPDSMSRWTKDLRNKSSTRFFFTPFLYETLDRFKISDQNALYPLMAATEAFSHNIENLIINYTSLQSPHLEKIQRTERRRYKRHSIQ